MRWTAAVAGLGIAAAGACTGEGGDPFPSSSSSGAGAGSSSSSTSMGGGGAGGATTSSASASSSSSAGGASTSSSSASSGGASCSVSSDCPGYPGGSCSPVTCAGGSCAVIPLVAGTVVQDSAPGDCQADVCDGAGGVVHVASAADVPDDANDCTTDLCSPQGQPQHANVAKGAACSSNGGTMCDGAGACVACVADADCGTPTPCLTPKCNAGSCADVPVPDGTACGSSCPLISDQFVCEQKQGCSWDSFWFTCKGPCDGCSCQSGVCAP
jgi:hypothetical protein